MFFHASISAHELNMLEDLFFEGMLDLVPVVAIAVEIKEFNKSMDR